jgi:hypothetical protein
MNKRLFKFRVFDKKENKFHYNGHTNDIVLFNKNGIFSLYPFYLNGKSEFKYEIQQFTGFLDKNLKEIYEGDICRLKYSYEESLGGQLNDQIGTIIFENGMYKFNNLPLFEYLNKDNILELEILGNSLQHKDILMETICEIK